MINMTPDSLAMLIKRELFDEFCNKPTYVNDYESTFVYFFTDASWRPSWILMVGLVKVQKRCQKWILHVKISRKNGITQLSIWFCFQVTFPIWPPAAILDFGFSQIPPLFLRGSWGLFFSKYFKELKSSVKPYYALSGHGTPRSHPTTWC